MEDKPTDINIDAKEATTEEILQPVTFRIGEEEFGVDILRVQEIIRMTDYTRVPNAPDFVVGVINLRGKVIPVIDFRIRLGLSKAEASKTTRIIVVEVSGKVVGFIVDRVNEVVRIPKSVTEPPPAMIKGISAEFITSLAKLETGLLILLDLEKLLAQEKSESQQ